ncbi:IS200/IS605 family transposase [Zavarzinella formosa]|uniref:IS200/IS605 family transposase n=1 Tax=Zavarzinella formosa TaxID=360055 RepID=UPI0002FEFCC5|nr:IS200/IS605 family transposase [Zavarzinella formosa]
MPQSFANVMVHYVFSTKGRESWLGDEIVQRLYPLIGGIIRERKCALLEIGGISDHVHLLVSQGREISISDLMRDVKSGSSKWIHETFPALQSFCWQAGYGAFSVSQSNGRHVRDYIQNQAVHHQRQTFQEEYREILRRHELEWDEQYVWD